jgi:phosphatidate cytidylyltransferase
MLRDRLLVSVPLIAAALLAFLVPGWPGGVLFTLLCVSFLVVACREFFALSARAGSGGYGVLTALGGLALVAIALCTSDGSPASMLTRFLADVSVATGFILLCFMAACREGVSPRSLSKAWVSIAGFFYVCWLTSFIPKLYFSGAGTSGPLLVLYLVFVTKIADAGAYTAGTLTARRPGGNHKLLPRISPKKSWEGLAGGTAASLLVAVLLQQWWGDRLLVLGRPALSFTDACVVGVGASVIGLVGDLSESALKRAADAKDSGRMPGLGGILDLLDSLIVTGPLFYAYITLSALLQ